MSECQMSSEDGVESVSKGQRILSTSMHIQIPKDPTKNAPVGEPLPDERHGGGDGGGEAQHEVHQDEQQGRQRDDEGALAEPIDAQPEDRRQHRRDGVGDTRHLILRERGG